MTPGDAQTQLNLALPYWELAKLEGGNAGNYLALAVQILRKLQADGKLPPAQHQVLEG